MKKNVFKKVIKVLDGSDQVIISREDNNYIISNKYIALKVTPEIYNAWFRVEKPYFVELESGESWISYKYERKHSIGHKLDYTKFDGCFNQNDTVTVKRTPYKKNAKCTTVKGKVGTAILFAADDFITGLDANFVEAFDEIFGAGAELKKGRREYAPIIWEAENVIAATMPVKIETTEVEEAIIKMFREVA